MRRVQSVHGLVPKLYAWGSGDEQWALAMTLCGPSLASIIGLGRLSMYSTLATVGEQMVRFSLTEPRCQLPDQMQIDCVQYVHSCGYVHCDIKPDNFCFSSDFERLVLVDFGGAQALPTHHTDQPQQPGSTFIGNVDFASLAAHQYQSKHARSLPSL